MKNTSIRVTVNGKAHESEIAPRLTLVDYLRDVLGLTGTHAGCEHGVCGACTVNFDGVPVRACLMFAVQAHGHAIGTVEGLASGDGTLSALQDAFWEAHAMQCGFCTPGMLMAADALLRSNPNPKDEDIKGALGGNLCRCTGYQQIIEAVHLAAVRTAKADG